MATTSTERMRALRARRAAGLEPDVDARLRDSGDLIAPAVAETLTQLNLGPEHAAAAQLARRYAQVIDECRDPAWGLRWIGPELLKALTELGATPAARHALTKGQRQAPAGPSGLDRLRAVRVSSDTRNGRL